MYMALSSLSQMKQKQGEQSSEKDADHEKV